MRPIICVALLLGFFAAYALFNFSYISNCGLLVNFSKASQVSGLHTHKEPTLSAFRMEPFCDAATSSAYVRRVMLLKDDWIIRNTAMSTLGTASYLDGDSDATLTNSLLSDCFPDLLHDVLLFFRARAPHTRVAYKENAALPGFHIFDCSSIFRLPVASIHRDMQYNRLHFHEFQDIDEENTLSFTLALELPASGAGLYVFDGEGPPHVLLPKLAYYNAMTKHKLIYKTGWMVTHQGKSLHMIAPSSSKTGELRITLQGHGVFDRSCNTWWLYW